ncbi:MAG: GNAT family N-acetyltransferase [Anaerolineae bacterium]
MKLTLRSDIEIFQELHSEWNSLLKRSIANRIFSTWEWQSIWWSAYHPGQLWVLTVRDEDNTLVAIAPWFIENHSEHGRVIRPIGCVDVTDYLDMIVANEHVEIVMREIAQFLNANKSEFDWVNLCNIPEKSPTLSFLPAYLSELGLVVQLTQQDVCPIIHLPSSWDRYFELLDKKQRHELRRKLRRIDGASEKVEWYIVNENHNLSEEIKKFIHLMASSQAEKAKFLTDSQNLDFFNSLVPAALHNNWLQLSFLTIDNVAAASYLNFVYGNSVLVYNSGLLPDQYGHLSPGIILLAYNIKFAIQSGYEFFDFLRGDETYKYRMGAQDSKVFMLTASETH